MESLVLIPQDAFPKLRELVKLFQQRGESFGFAESCTGGLLSTWVTSLPGVSSVFKGSVISYAGEVKIRVLGVPRSSIAVHGEVSQPVALGMARGARDVLSCSWAVSLTGIAGPSGGSVDKPVGTVCFAVVGPGVEKSVIRHFDSKQSRTNIQRQAAFFALDLLLDELK